MRIGSLCSGIGGFELGLEWAGLGETVWQVELDPFCRRILGKHWPRARQYENLFHVGKHNLAPIDLLCFGFPCQDLSSAGAQVGLGGARSGLFYQCTRIAEELSPEWIVVENVASGSKLWVDACCAELERLGYACLPIPLSARDVGALHIRARVFIVAHADRERQRAIARLAEVAGPSKALGAYQSAERPDADEVGHQARLSERLTDARGRPESDGMGREAAGAPDTDQEQLRVEQQRDARRRNAVRYPREAESEFPGWGEPEPDVVRVVPGLSQKLDATRVGALGNAIVPSCAEAIGWVIRELIAEAFPEIDTTEALLLDVT